MGSTHCTSVVGVFDDDVGFSQGNTSNDIPSFAFVGTAPDVLGRLIVVDDDLGWRSRGSAAGPGEN